MGRRKYREARQNDRSVVSGSTEPACGFAAGLAGAFPALGVDVPFAERVISTGADDATSVFATDVDGDGNIDVLSASWNDDKIAWYENRTCPSTSSTCGDGELCSETEQCDDGGTDDADGCSSTCTIEDGWDCTGEPSLCMTTCGDGVIAGSEECDDGNADPDDGCAPTCSVEGGWSCTGQPSVCTTICGDAICTGGENLENCPDDCAVPAVSEWGAVTMTLLVLLAGTVVLRRRWSGPAAST